MFKKRGPNIAANVLLAATLAACGGNAAEPHVPPFTVIGQASFQGQQVNQGRGSAVTATTLNAPLGSVTMAEDGTLFIPDSFNDRVLGFRQVPESNNAPADFVVGKQGLTASPSKISSRTELNAPLAVSAANGKLAVSSALHRILIYSPLPTTDGPPAAVVVGQSSFDDTTTLGCTQAGLNEPHAIVLTPNGKLVVADSDHHRVLIWNRVPETNAQPADVVLGQPDFDHCSANNASVPGANTLNEPYGLWSDGHRLIVADSANSRVLIWNQMPADGSQNFKPADIVLGQTSMSGNTQNDSDGDGTRDAGPSATTLAFPRALHSDGKRLAVADTGNHRVLLWNSIPTQSGTPPDRIIGQMDFKHGAPNDLDGDGAEDSATSELVLNLPRGVFLKGRRLFVSDASNNRVLIIRLD